MATPHTLTANPTRTNAHPQNYIERLPVEMLWQIFSHLRLRDVILLAMANGNGRLTQALATDLNWRQGWAFYTLNEHKARLEAMALFRLSMTGKWIYEAYDNRTYVRQVEEKLHDRYPFWNMGQRGWTYGWKRRANYHPFFLDVGPDACPPGIRRWTREFLTGSKTNQTAIVIELRMRDVHYYEILYEFCTRHISLGLIAKAAPWLSVQTDGSVREEDMESPDREAIMRTRFYDEIVGTCGHRRPGKECPPSQQVPRDGIFLYHAPESGRLPPCFCRYHRSAPMGIDKWTFEGVLEVLDAFCQWQQHVIEKGDLIWVDVAFSKYYQRAVKPVRKEVEAMNALSLALSFEERAHRVKPPRPAEQDNHGEVAKSHNIQNLP